MDQWIISGIYFVYALVSYNMCRNINFKPCFSRLHGSYEALKYGTSLDGLSDFTGGIAESVSLRSDPTSCGRLLAKLLDLTSIVTSVVTPHVPSSKSSQSPSSSSSTPEKLASGIVLGVNYRIYCIEKASFCIFVFLFH